jgi:hypothetical protein
MTQEDHDDAMDAAAENMNARDMTIDINQETTAPVLKHPPPARHAGLVLGKFGLVWFGVIFPKLQTEWFSFCDDFPNLNLNR